MAVIFSLPQLRYDIPKLVRILFDFIALLKLTIFVLNSNVKMTNIIISKYLICYEKITLQSLYFPC